MAKITTILFDFDGVLADTEPLYDLFWQRIAENYHIDIPHFPAKIKGTTLQHIFEIYFSGYSREEIDKIAQASAEYELEMDFPEITGACAFLHYLKDHHYKLGLVTSSTSVKMQVALRKMGLEQMFDTIVTSERVTKGKPDPMGYLLAACDLQVESGECVVFEDSFSGIQAGTAAGMKTIGLSTTNSAESIRDKVSAVIADFQNKEEIIALL